MVAQPKEEILDHAPQPRGDGAPAKNVDGGLHHTRTGGAVGVSH